MTYPSGPWDGFWQQTGWGRQPMQEFTLTFRGHEVVGQGTDVIGAFTIRGTADASNGRVAFRKKYVGAHAVSYVGQPDGEGSIMGTWMIDGDYTQHEGSFLIRPVVKRSDGSEAIREIRPRS